VVWQGLMMIEYSKYFEECQKFGLGVYMVASDKMDDFQSGVRWLHSMFRQQLAFLQLTFSRIKPALKDEVLRYHQDADVTTSYV